MVEHPVIARLLQEQANGISALPAVDAMPVYAHAVSLFESIVPQTSVFNDVLETTAAADSALESQETESQETHA